MVESMEILFADDFTGGVPTTTGWHRVAIAVADGRTALC